MEEKNSSPKHPERNSKSIKVAIFSILAIFILYFGTNFLKGIDKLSKKEYYYSIYDNSGGLYKGAIVYLHGYSIGKVTKVNLVNSNPVQILVEYVINERINIPFDSRFEVTSRDMLGGTIVRLELGKAQQYAAPGDTLSCGLVPQLTDGLESMKDQIVNILASVDTISMSLKNVLAGQSGAEKLAQTLSNIESMTASLDKIIASNKTNFGKIVSDISKFSETLTNISPELKRIVANFAQISDSLAKVNVAEVIVNANQTIIQLEEAVRKINSGEGDIAKLLNEDDLYNKLGNSINSLDELLIDIKKNPKRYINLTIFGKKEKEK
ncbi:MAG: MlaD family protein [Bacteroidales bacterium]|jgi:phospholipid/cholesterol/gamma-HCH transport system substrate-binding protein|nr:MlaD family protein [Bacteroidales bacterium]